MHYGLGRHIETVSAEHLIKEAKVVHLQFLVRLRELTPQGLIRIAIDLGNLYFPGQGLNSGSLYTHIRATEVYTLFSILHWMLRRMLVNHGDSSLLISMPSTSIPLGQKYPGLMY